MCENKNEKVINWLEPLIRPKKGEKVLMLLVNNSLQKFIKSGIYSKDQFKNDNKVVIQSTILGWMPQEPLIDLY